MYSRETKEMLIENYRARFLKYRTGPSVAQWASAYSQTLRFDQFMTLADFNHQTVLDVGCNIGDFYPVLKERFPDVIYSGIDIVPEVIEHAKQRFPLASFECRDILQDPLIRQYDYVFMSGIFNNDIPDPTDFLKALTIAGYEVADKALAFNFLSTHTNMQEGLSYHDPAVIMTFALTQLSRKVSMFHHYASFDVAVFVHRPVEK